ncbi:hypothetical protein HNQ94_000962 [Salirhabdus euzebyi]|uniref:Uncharacterized protein n=1 Tax=Salirhabdus euzebyi TaxID=394506 RepID=A0A841PU49_9BACI|nr:hypothetical protein [Salirhabdus euzebyi]MBB6452517.1 hypothetical protein [Salirhabdus euzebyi]
MTFEELVKEKGYSISFESIIEPRTNDVKLRIIVNKSENPTDLLIFPHPDSKVQTLQIDFKNYVTYSVIYMVYTVENSTEIADGDAFQIYGKSNYYDFIQRETVLNTFFPNDKLIHYSLACMEHKVDIISKHEPIITEIDPKTIKK